MNIKITKKSFIKIILLFITLSLILLNFEIITLGTEQQDNNLLIVNNLQKINQITQLSRSISNQSFELRYIEDNFLNDSLINYEKNIIIDTIRTEVRLLPYNYTFYKIIEKNDGTDENYSIQQTSDGGYIIVGTLHVFDYNICLIKTDANGNVEWQKIFNGWDINPSTMVGIDDYGESVLQTDDDGYIILATTTAYGVDNEDILVIKTDSMGNIVWNKKFGGQESDFGSEIHLTADGYIIIGTTSSYGGGKEDIWVIKIDKFGSMLWNKTFGDRNKDYGNSIEITPEGGLLILGETIPYGDWCKDIWLIKINEAGEIIWNKTFGNSCRNFGEMIRQTSDGNYILITTTSFQDIPGGFELWIIKINENGEILWEKTYGGKSDEYGYSIQQTADNGYIVIGTTRSYGYGSEDVWLVKLNITGDIEWSKTFGGRYEDYGYSVQQADDGGYIFVGSSWSPGYGSLISTNLLYGNYASSINEFNYTASIPNKTNIKIQFSQDNHNWYNSLSLLNDWEILSNGSHSIDLSTFIWKGSNFYYRVNFSSTNLNVSALQYINLSYIRNLDMDEDNLPDSEDLDNDNDNYLDDWEEYLDTNPNDPNDRPLDTDNDDLPDGDYYNLQSWMDTDDDNDEMPDGWERKYGLNPTNSSDANQDKDKDGFTNKEEYDADTNPVDPDDHPEKDNKLFNINYKIFIILIVIIIVVLILLAAVMSHRKKIS